ncbi:MBL fold metallo-hydrolase [Candidatus Micrarchaeota archaeon]|nr:MBL fold metallo-hydrolase [Candidatus Micrarchaeota archaeon]
MKIDFLGAGMQVGRSSFEVACKSGLRVLLDAGSSNQKEDRLPLHPIGEIDAAIVTHAHLDHAGYLPAHFAKRSFPWYCTFPTLPLSELLWHDSIKVAKSRGESPYLSEKEIKISIKKCVLMPYGERYEFFEGTAFTFIDAGHIPGSAQVLLESGGKSVLYTGDFNTSDSRLHEGAVVPAEGIDANALIIESTYALRDHPPRRQLEKDFCENVDEVLDDGNALIPTFAVGRMQEMVQVLRAGGIKARIYLDGMGVEASRVICDFPSYVRDYGALSAALDSSKSVLSGSGRKKIAAGKGSVILTTAGMLDGGPALTYLREMSKAERGAVLLTGYQAAGTNGRSLVEKGMVKDNGRPLSVNLPVTRWDFSAHAGRKELYDFVRKANPSKVICVHGDPESCTALKEGLELQGFDAVTPTTGDAVEV